MSSAISFNLGQSKILSSGNGLNYQQMSDSGLCSSSISLYYTIQSFKSLPNDKFLDQFKLKAFAYSKINVIQKQKFFSGWVEKIVGKGYQHFLLFPQCFQKASFSGLLKVSIVW